MIDVLNMHFQDSLQLSRAQSAWVQFANYMGYFLMAIPAGLSISDYVWMFQYPFFHGVMEFNGELYEGKHQPIITKHLFDRVQEVMALKSKPKTPQLKPYLYRGLFRCGECGCFITTETQKGHNYLRCTKRVVLCTQKYVREEA